MKYASRSRYIWILWTKVGEMEIRVVLQTKTGVTVADRAVKLAAVPEYFKFGGAIYKRFGAHDGIYFYQQVEVIELI